MKIKRLPPGLLVAGFFTFCFFRLIPCTGQYNDTIKVMAYNTLAFGPGSCQTPGSGQVSTAYPYLKAIIQYANPDIVGLDKMQCVKVTAGDAGISPISFPDTVISECFSPTFSYCPFTDISGCSDGDGTVVFYNTAKLGYVSTTNLYYGTEDIDLYKLYYKDPFLPATHDTTYLYVVPCHTISGTSSTGRDSQDTTIIGKLQRMFGSMPNLIYMGDFNTHNSGEPGYAYITQTNANTNFIMDDPDFHPDAILNYPINWNSNPSAAAKELTTTTRSSTVPNSCGTTGGAKDWYDHILLSQWIINNTDYISYIRNSYTTIGNDGNRVGVSVNTGTNTSAPANVISAVFNFSDKYPVMVSLGVTNHPLGINNILGKQGSIRATNPVLNNSIILHFASFMNGQNVTMDIYDVCGRDLYTSAFAINSSTIIKDVSLAPGVYLLHFTSGGYATTLKIIKE